jgi:tRNA-dihydrouridine synthase B
MIGRAARGRPWIFRELDHYRRTGTNIACLDKNKLRDIMLGHLDELHRFYGVERGVRVARKHLTWYCAGLKNAEEFRSQVVRVESASEQIRLTQQFFDHAVGGVSLAV